ncbi:MAG: Cys-tRNA(Pro) deacylase [Succinivibrionaceae bacterium]|nr:Cys-tRNA(Pro) deacylase [Ruminobacter sp.]MDY5780185.1 Cys-tRNA(Pro) deacylase [Succinivibrionaceae bacterium]MEE1340856.1 Cys-tRNA(Pro) deacylase [Succinivibrionaceae bacterium]
MTPATKFLDANKIPYKIYQYECSANHDFGHLAAEKLNRPQNEVFKTLLIFHEKTYITAVIPVNCTLNLKSAAKLAGVKNAEMVKPQDAERLTGYVCGGISPFGQKKRTITVIAQDALALPEILVSGGRRGLSVGINPNDLVKALNAKSGEITELHEH